MRDFACPHCGQRLAFENPLSRSCSLTRTRPADGEAEMCAFAVAERAKRRLVVPMVDHSMGHRDLYPFARDEVAAAS